jgi:hypothetical protein
MSQDNNILMSFYYPVCKEEGCNGTLKIAKNSDNLTINYVCDKNALHKNKNIKYNDFSNEYLKKQKCEKIEKCKEHDEVISRYCNDCKKFICKKCLGNCRSKNHPITLLDKYKINQKQLNYLIKSLNDKKKDINILSTLIEEWKKELNQKLEEMKQELENEIKLIEKLILNYNKDFNNITYHKNILYLKDRVFDNNNYYLTKFYNSDNFYEKTYSICKYFLFSKSSKDSFYYDDYNDPYDLYGEKIISGDYDYEIKAIKTQKNIGRLSSFFQIKNNYFFGTDYDDTANIYNYNKNDGLNSIYKLKIENLNQYGLTPKLSIDKKQIFLSSQGGYGHNCKIIILNLDLSKYKIELSSDKIDFQFQLQDNLLYCIEIKKGLIAAVCQTNIIILNKKNKII